jgi:MerR family copper efflux transcriptional regulator
VLLSLDLQVDLKVYVRWVTTGHRIADVARRSGFTPATLRYYEEIGLLPAPERSSGGYRIYDDRALDRLSFIARAKQLGCTLDEIADLSVAWDGGQCGPIQERLRMVVRAKLAEAHARVVELAKLTAELRAAATALEQHRPEGPCDDRCGCTTVAPSAVIALGDRPPQPGDPSPIACTLPVDAVPGRVEDWAEVLRSVTSRSSVDGGVRLGLDPDVPIGDLARLARAEQDCCRFFSFALTVDAHGVGLEVRAPDDALSIVHALFGAPT